MNKNLSLQVVIWYPKVAFIFEWVTFFSSIDLQAFLSFRRTRNINRHCIFHVPLIQQCNKKVSASLMWVLKSSGVIANRPWPRIMITLITTAIILTMAVFNMVSSIWFCCSSCYIFSPYNLPLWCLKSITGSGLSKLECCKQKFNFVSQKNYYHWSCQHVYIWLCLESKP